MKFGGMVISNGGVKQADEYMDGLHITLADIAENIDKATVRDVPINLMSPVKVFHYGRHYLFFREASNRVSESIQVLSILHDLHRHCEGAL